MALDIKSHKKKISGQKPVINLVPLIDIIFCLLIFLVVTSSFGETSSDETAVSDSSGTGKPNVTDTSGSQEYYLIPVHNLKTVTVNGQDMSHLIKNGGIGVHSRVIDEGEIITKSGTIIITTPPGMSPEMAVKSPG